MDDWPEPYEEIADLAQLRKTYSNLEGAEEASSVPADLVDEDVLALLAGSAVGQRMVQIALSQRGVRETGGPNRGVPFDRYVRPFGFAQPIPWCACFVSWCYWQTTGSKPQWPNPAYVGSIYNWARGARRLTREPSQGDMFGIGDDHVGLVAARLRNGQIRTIEGNWGDRVLSRDVPVAGLWFATPSFP